MRNDIQDTFRSTPHEKQVTLFSVTLSKEVCPVSRNFCEDPMEIYVEVKQANHPSSHSQLSQAGDDYLYHRR